MKSNQLILFCCSCLLAVAVFLPLINLPFVGSVNYFMNGEGDGRYILFLALVSAILCFTKYSQWVAIPGTLSLVILTFFLLSYEDKFGHMESLDNAEIFAGFARALTRSISIGYGFVLMAIASAGLLLFPLIFRKQER